MGAQALPEQLDVHFRLARSDLLQDSFRKSREFALTSRTVNNGNAVAIDTDVTSTRIDDLKAISFLLSNLIFREVLERRA